MMNFETLQPYIIPFGILLFIAWKFYQIQNAKKAMPDLLAKGAQIVDVRSAQEFMQGHNPKSINIPLDTIKTGLSKLDKSKPVIVCCASGTRSGAALAILKGNGFKEVINVGAWSNTLDK